MPTNPADRLYTTISVPFGPITRGFYIVNVYIGPYEPLVH